MEWSDWSGMGRSSDFSDGFDWIFREWRGDWGAGKMALVLTVSRFCFPYLCDDGDGVCFDIWLPCSLLYFVRSRPFCERFSTYGHFRVA